MRTVSRGLVFRDGESHLLFQRCGDSGRFKLNRQAGVLVVGIAPTTFVQTKKKALLSQDLFSLCWCPRETVGFHIIQGLQRCLVVRDTSRDTDSFRLVRFHLWVE